MLLAYFLDFLSQLWNYRVNNLAKWSNNITRSLKTEKVGWAKMSCYELIYIYINYHDRADFLIWMIMLIMQYCDRILKMTCLKIIEKNTM